MKYTLFGIFIGFIIGVIVYGISQLKNEYIKQPIIITHPTEYHFNVDVDGYDIFTEDMKPVGRLKYGQNPTLDSLINADNQ